MSSTPMGDAKLDSLLHSEEDLKHSEECSYWFGMCGSCKKNFDEKKKLEIEVLDDCIKGYFDAAFGPNSQGDHDSDIKRLMHSLSTEAMDDLRNEWRRKFNEKFILKDNWADQDLEFWNGNYHMMNGARAVYEAAQMKRPLSDVEAEPSQDDIAEADEDIEKVLLGKLDAQGRLKKKVKRVPRP